MKSARPALKQRCAVYTRKSTEEGLDMAFNSLDAQREACEAYVASQKAEGWLLVPDRYDDGGFSGGNLERPALKCLLADIEWGRIDIVVVYKVDRLSRSLRTGWNCSPRICLRVWRAETKCPRGPTCLIRSSICASEISCG